MLSPEGSRTQTQQCGARKSVPQCFGIGPFVEPRLLTFPQKSFHGTVIGIPLDALAQVVQVKPLLTGLAVTLQSGGRKEFVISD